MTISWTRRFSPKRRNSGIGDARRRFSDASYSVRALRKTYADFVAAPGGGPGLPRWPEADDRIMIFSGFIGAAPVLPPAKLQFYQEVFAGSGE